MRFDFLRMKTAPREIEIDEVQIPGRALTGDASLMAAIARLMDNAFVIPGTTIRFGLDPLIGLIPGFGDTAGAVISSLLLLQGARSGVPKIVLARMALNVLINTAIGAIPVFGDVFSVSFKSNAKNLLLLQRHGSTGRRSTAGDWWFVIALVAGLIGAVVACAAGLFWLVASLNRMGQ